jgi:hypothetical protein
MMDFIYMMFDQFDFSPMLLTSFSCVTLVYSFCPIILQMQVFVRRHTAEAAGRRAHHCSPFHGQFL